MKLWIDAQLSPALATWLSDRFGVEALAVRDVGLRNARDQEIFFAAREAGATILTKDADFVRLVEKHGPPPSVLWLTSGNTSNARVRELLDVVWPKAIQLLGQGETLVELQNLK